MKSNQASTTAKVIAAGTILLASDHRTAEQVAPQAAALCRIFLSGSRADRLLASSAAWPLTRGLWRGVERLVLPGIVAHYWHRKRWIEAQCRLAIADGFERLIVLGAGFDTLAYRLARQCGQLDVIEIDHPATQGSKQRALAASGLHPPPNLRFIACDLGREPLALDRLGDDGATMVIIEGVLMYLPPADVDRVFQNLHALSANPLRVVFSAMAKWPDGGIGFRPQSWLVSHWLAWRREPFKWAIELDAIEDFLIGHGYKVTELAQAWQLRGAATASADVLQGENLVACEPLG